MPDDNRLFVNAVHLVLHSGAGQDDLPARHGTYKSVYARFMRWARSGVCELLEGQQATAVIVEKCYDSDQIVASIERLEAAVVIPPCRHRLHKRDYDRELYKLRKSHRTMPQCSNTSAA